MCMLAIKNNKKHHSVMVLGYYLQVAIPLRLDLLNGDGDRPSLVPESCDIPGLESQVDPKDVDDNRHGSHNNIPKSRCVRMRAGDPVLVIVRPDHGGYQVLVEASDQTWDLR